MRRTIRLWMIVCLSVALFACASPGRERHGTKSYPNGDKYVGIMKYGSPYGYGTFTWANGDEYVGEYRVITMVGRRGTFTSADGSKYVGGWKRDKWKIQRKHGPGTYTSADGLTVKSGLWDLGVFQGKPKYLSKQTTQKIAKTPARKTAPTIKVIKQEIATDVTPPTINIEASIQVDTDSPTISGTVSDESNVVQVLVNGTAANFRNNSFTFTRYVPASGTKVTIKVVDEWGNVAAKVVTITREIAQITPVRFDPLDPTTFSVKSNPNAVALIIGIADYKRTPSAQYADNDATIFADYARRKLGVSSNNIKVLTNDSAGFIDILEAVSDWLPNATRAGRTDVYVFFAGHGLSSSDGQDVFLLPYNGSAKLLGQTALRRSELFDTIAEAKPRSVTVFLDTCYSGTTRTDEMLVAQRGVRIVPKEQLIPVGFTVFSAAGMKQTASMLPEAEHGLFSYWLMKGMEGDADSNGDRVITAGELHDYALANVSRLQRSQTPELQGDAERVLVRW
jgi:hypothetical protein